MSQIEPAVFVKKKKKRELYPLKSRSEKSVNDRKSHQNQITIVNAFTVDREKHENGYYKMLGESH